MTFDRPRTEAVRVEDLLDWAQAGRLRIPSFPHSFLWSAVDVERLFDSIWRGYPIGSLLLWERAAEADRVDFGGVEIDGPVLSHAYFVVDGQQRVTSLVAGLLGAEVVGSTFVLYFDLRSGKIERAAGRHVPPYWLPVGLIGRRNLLFDWMLRFRAQGGNDTELDRARRFAEAVLEYRVPVTVVEGEDDRVLRDIFDRMNPSGRRLKRRDVFDALHRSR